MSNVPIANYALLSDCRSAALVSSTGSLDWLCFPRFDAPSVFARLLDEQAGHWSIHAVGTTETHRRYIDTTMVLETRFTAPTGIAVLVDAMAIGRNERGHQLGVANMHQPKNCRVLMDAKKPAMNASHACSAHNSRYRSVQRPINRTTWLSSPMSLSLLISEERVGKTGMKAIHGIFLSFSRFLLSTAILRLMHIGHQLGVASPGVVLRSISCESGSVEVELEYAPRSEYGLISPLLRPVEGGVASRGGADVLVLSSQRTLAIEGSTARTRFTLHAGEQANFSLQHQTSWEEAPQVYTSAAITDSLHDTLAGWRT